MLFDNIFADLTRMLAVMVMRAYGFTGRDKKILVGLSLGYLTLVGVNLGVFITTVTLPGELFYELMGPTGCFPNYGTTVMADRLAVSSHSPVLSPNVS